MDQGEKGRGRAGRGGKNIILGKRSVQGDSEVCQGWERLWEEWKVILGKREVRML